MSEPRNPPAAAQATADPVTAYFDLLSTPFGELELAVDGAGHLLAVAFLNADRKPSCIQTPEGMRRILRRAGFRVAPHVASPSRDPHVADARTQLDDYSHGRRRTFELETRLLGTPFQQQVWRALEAIPFGALRTYGELARQLGRPGGARAVGGAVGANPISIVVPCHRVVGSSGTLTGYAGGLAFKRGLLELEGSLQGLGLG